MLAIVEKEGTGIPAVAADAEQAGSVRGDDGAAAPSSPSSAAAEAVVAGAQAVASSTKDGEVTESVARLVDKALTVAELILRHERYRMVVEDSPDLIFRVLKLLDTLESRDSKLLALRVISSLGRSGANQKEIGRQDGYRQMLTMLNEGDEELTREIASTLKMLLNAAEQESELSANKFSFRDFASDKLSDLTSIFRRRKAGEDSGSELGIGDDESELGLTDEDD